MKVEKDKIVSFHYTLSLDSGDVVDSTKENEPLNFLVGHNQIIPGLENGMMEMETGEKKKVTVEPEEGYGNRDEERVQSVGRDQVPDNIELQEGMVLSGKTEDGQRIEVSVQSFDDENVVLDLNHPLAGENLNFDVEVVDVREPTQEELEHGHAH